MSSRVTADTEEPVERERELTTLRGVIRQTLAGEGSVVTVAGEAGIGKSTLLRCLIRDAKPEPVTVLSARGSDLERDFTFGVVRQLFDLVLNLGDRDLSSLFDGQAALARDLLLDPGLTPDTGEADRTFALFHGLYWALVNLADDQPVILVVDDAQWSDDPSLRFLAFLAGRLDGTPISMVIGMRDGPDGDQPMLHALRQSGTAIDLRPLSSDSVATIVQSMLRVDPDPSFTTALHRATGGVPFYVRELLTDLERDDVAPTRQAAARLSDTSSQSIVRNVIGRAGRVRGRGVALCRALSVAGSMSTVELLATLIDEPPATVVSLMGQLADRGLLHRHEVEFSHPIVATSVYADINGHERATLHERVAAELHRSGAPDEQIAAHLLRSASDRFGWAVDAYRGAAHTARARGGTADAVIYLRRAVAASGTDDSIGTTDPLLMFELGEAEFQAGDPESIGHLRQAFETGCGEPWWPAAARILARALSFNGGKLRAAVDVMDEALARFDQTDAAEARRLLVDWMFFANMTVETAVDSHARRPGLIDELVEADPDAARVLRGTHALAGVHVGVPVEECLVEARLAWGTGDRLLVESAGSQDHWGPIHAFIAAGDLTAGIRAATALLDAARRQGSQAGLGMGYLLRSMALLRQGRLVEAEADAVDAVDHTHDAFPIAAPGAAGTLVTVLIEQGRLDDAEALVARSEFVLDNLPLGLGDTWLTGIGLLRLAQGRWGEAYDVLRRSGNRMEQWMSLGPAVVPWRRRLARAAAGLGHADEALDHARTEVELAEGFGCRGARAIALRTLALVGPADDRCRLLESARDLVSQTHFQLDLAKIQVDLGTSHRREGKVEAARSELRAGLAGATRCKAGSLAEHARNELLATGARPRRTAVSGVHALTASERRVCNLAADGMTNRQIAQALFVTTKTVEVHLTNSYRKLAISSRTALTDALQT